MKLASIMLLRSANHHLLQVLEVLNLIDEDDYVELVKKCRTKKAKLKQITDNVERGSPFLTALFFMELLDEVINEQPVNDSPG